MLFTPGTFTIGVQYADAADQLQVPSRINLYTIGPFQSNHGERSEMNVKSRLNLHGTVSRLREITRNHLANLNKYKDQRDRPDLLLPESLQLYQDTRFEQLKVATELDL
ncbi:hypothetical protein C5167_003543, partial [Papaver somniferum]